MGSNSREAYTGGSRKKSPLASATLSLPPLSTSTGGLPPSPAGDLQRPPLPPMCRRPLLLPSLPEPARPPPSPLTSSSSPWRRPDSLQGAPLAPSPSRPARDLVAPELEAALLLRHRPPEMRTASRPRARPRLGRPRAHPPQRLALVGSCPQSSHTAICSPSTNLRRRGSTMTPPPTASSLPAFSLP
jgi:hypothetical protein